MRLLLILVAVAILHHQHGSVLLVRADFGDYVDPTYNCPATTTCPKICAATVEQCPTKCADGLTLCADGTCEEECADDIESPCEFDCAKVACARTIDTYDACKETYKELYEAEVACGEAEVAEKVNKFQFNEAGFVVVYSWVAIASALILVWCFYNQKIASVPGSAQRMNLDDKNEKTESLQIGYKLHPIGMVLHGLTLMTLAGWIALLAWLTIQYYALDGSEKVSRRKVVFEDEVQLLQTFIVVWSIGLVWCFTLKWPYSIQSLFLRRCMLYEATHVGIFMKLTEKEAPAANKTSGGCIDFLSLLFARAAEWIRIFMSLLFSDSDCYHWQPNSSYMICPVQRESDYSRFIVLLFRRYQFDNESSMFVSGNFAVGQTINDLQAAGNSESGLAATDVEQRLRAIGPNSIEMPKPVVWKVIFDEFCKPFYTYQLFMIFSWFPLYYYYMACVWSGVVVTSGLTVAFFQYRNLATLHKITLVNGTSTVLRGGEFVELDQKQLVPGDIVKIKPCIAFSDMVLVSGGATLVDESALTGEATPQGKTPINRIEPEVAKSAYSALDHKRQTITAGTTVLETDDSIGLVVQTGSYTAKGELMRDIFSFRRHNFKFDSEVYIVMGILVLYAIVAFNIAVVFIEDLAVYGWFYGMYIVGAILPPLLPTVFTVAVGVSEDRLSKKRIATVNAESILIAGKVKIAFFDKTGTLTKQGLDFLGTRSAVNWNLPPSMDISDELKTAMATCHSLTMTQDGRVTGTPVDRTMFSVSGGKIDADSCVTTAKGEQVTVVRHFDFDHHRMSQSVVLKYPDGTYVAVVKGSGESIQKMCVPKTMPADFDSALHESCKNGIYQISVASKVIAKESVDSLSRNDVESDLNFVGVIDFKNVIREDTPGVINELTNGDVRSIIVTGDSVLAGIRVAKECGIMSPHKPVVIAGTSSKGGLTWSDYNGNPVDMPLTEGALSGSFELAISGRAWEILLLEHPKAVLALAPFASVFGRLTPHDKVSVIKTYVDLGFVTLMSGDGGNDVGALKAAHVGVALSDAEASIVAPFTSLDKTITSVVDVVKEGRCALASAIATYKYMIMYGQVETVIQLISAYFQITPSEFCWVFMDGIWTITMAFSLPLSGPAAVLSKSRPTTSILSLHTLSSALGVLSINFIFTVIGLAVLWQQDWFQCRKWDSNDVSNVLVIGDNYETQVIFLVSGYQYVSSAIAFNFGYEFRRGWWRNYVFVAFALFYTFLQFYITMVPSKLSCVWRVNCVNEDTLRSVTSADPMPIQNPFNTTVMPESFRWKILLIMICNAMATSGYEYFIVNGVRRNFGSAAKKKKSAATAALAAVVTSSGRGNNSSAHDRATQQVHDELAHEPKFKLLHETNEAQA